MNTTNDKIAVSIRNLGLFYPSDDASLQSEVLRKLREFGNWINRARRGQFAKVSKPVEFGAGERWIFRNVSFDIKHGEVFGIIGRNGCGKTTMLKIFSRVLFPSEGTVTLNGRVAALLAVGTGFHMEYTGRENIFLNGMILGLSREQIETRFDQIVDFADIGDAIEMPVRTYSSGMRARLAFAVAAQLKSDIVILDEILSVGDAGFRDRSLSVIQNMKMEGRTVILVSHNMAAIDTYCDRAMVISDGSVKEIGKPKNVIQGYLESFQSIDAEDMTLRERQDREGTGALRIVGYELETGSGLRIFEPQTGDEVVICFEYETGENKSVRDVDFGIAFFSEEGYKLSRYATENLGNTFAELPPKGVIKLRIPRFPYARGQYLIGFRATVEGDVADYIPNGFKIKVGDGDFYGTGIIDDHSPVLVPHDWSAEQLPEGPSKYQKLDKPEPSQVS